MTKRMTPLLAIATLVLAASTARAESLTFTKLTGITGGQIAGTAVYRADLSGLSLSRISSITLTDASGGFGGFSGQFSGYDLDAIKLSSTQVDTAADAKALVGDPVFNFLPTGTHFTPGTQRPVADPKLFGTGTDPTQVDPTVATLGDFDGNATIYAPYVKGFVSMGDGGSLTFDLSCLATSGLFLYIGEVGDNGEIVDGSVVDEKKLRLKVSLVSAVPEPASVVLLGGGLLALVAVGWNRRRAQ